MKINIGKISNYDLSAKKTIHNKTTIKKMNKKSYFTEESLTTLLKMTDTERLKKLRQIKRHEKQMEDDDMGAVGILEQRILQKELAEIENSIDHIEQELALLYRQGQKKTNGT